jgi:thioesterase domain-containing protein
MCDGVRIAQEMIVQLESLGEEVALFAILDTWVLENSQVRMLWAIDYYLERLRTFRYLPHRRKLATLQRTFKRLVGRNASGNTGWAQAYWPDLSFHPPRFSASVLLFKRPRQPFYYVRDPEMGWGARSTGGVEICEVRCGHFQILRQPHVEVVAEQLSARLHRIEEQIRGKATTATPPGTPLTVQSEEGLRSEFTRPALNEGVAKT